MTAQKSGRNDACPCGSGKKFKHCCGSGSASVAGRATVIARALDQAVQSFERGQFQQAVSLCQDILRADATHYQAMTLLGVLAYYAGNTSLAIQLLERSLGLQPRQPDAHNNLGEIHRANGRLSQAVQHFQRALAIQPNHIGALINSGNALQDVYDYGGAIAQYQKVLALQPRHTGAMSNLANVYQQQYQHTKSLAVLDELLAIDPDYDWAAGGKLYSRIHQCDWRDYSSQIAAISHQIRQGKRPIKVFEWRPVSDDAALELQCARTFAETLYPADPMSLSRNPSHSRLKIAYVSGDFRQHPVSQLLVEVLEQHDRQQFEVIGISLGPDDGSALRQRIVSTFDVFHDVRQRSDAEVAALLRELEVDIAVDLMGYTTHARPAIFALRASPVQIGYLGYAGTTGSQNMDFIIADEVIIPPHLEQHYSETVLRLPAPLLPRDRQVKVGQPPSRRQAGLPETGLVFCAFNNHYKITPDIFAVWMHLLSQHADSVLWLSDAADTIKYNLRREASVAGIDPERLIFAPRLTDLSDHLARHQLADLFLDTYPYNAHTTASDALWACLPVLTLQGEIFASRVAASLLQALGLNELITDNLQAYEQAALELARSPGRRQTLRQHLQQQHASSVFDATQYARNLEQCYREAANSGSLQKAIA